MKTTISMERGQDGGDQSRRNHSKPPPFRNWHANQRFVQQLKSFHNITVRLDGVAITEIEDLFLNLRVEDDEIADERGHDKQHLVKKDACGSNDADDQKKGRKISDEKSGLTDQLEEPLLILHDETGPKKHGYDKQHQMNIGAESSRVKYVHKKKRRDKHYIRPDARGMSLLGQDARNMKSQMIYRSDIDMLNAHFLATYESLIPTEEEKSKQMQLLTLLKILVGKEWPKAELFLYGSCANSFALPNSDIDVCFKVDDTEISKSDQLLRLAEIMQSENFQNVKALTRTRVPIVKLLDPATGISCDLCMNNVLSAENSKLLRDYAQIDVRLRQLVFIVKHWAKSRGVNETYVGTLSSYAYALMCVHFLQQCKPAILPCLQGMETTYSVAVDNFQCAYFDRVEELRSFGSHNKENIAQLVWAFFHYWAYCHDYENNVISVRTGSIISKQSKEWTTSVGNDHHFLSIEDPFETSHDLGRMINSWTLKVMRVEFERAAHIMQHDPNACVNLFEHYIQEGPLWHA